MLKLVEIEWDDAQSCGNSSWTVYDSDTKGLMSTPQKCKSVGYLMPETDSNVYVICGSLGLGAHKTGQIDQISGHMTIPRGMVSKVRTLK